MNPPNPTKLIHQSHPGLRLLLIAVGFLIFGLSTTRMFATGTNNLWNATNDVSGNWSLYWTEPNNWINSNTNGAAGVAGIPGTSGNVTLGNFGGTLTFLTIPITGAPTGSVLSVLGGGINAFTTNNLTSIITNNQTIHWLYLCPTNGANNQQFTNGAGGMQNLYITNGATLTVQGTDDNGMGPLGDFDNTAPPLSTLNPLDTMYVGRKAAENNSGLQNNATQVTISGGGTLFLNNTNNEMMVRDCNSSGGTHPATLDMSALANFQANLARIKIGVGEQNSTNLRAAALVYLAMTNHFVLGGTNTGELDNFVLGVNPQNAGNASSLFLGWSNGIYAETILLGGRKSGGANMSFNPTFANSSYLAGQPTPTAYFRNSKGGPVTYFRVGDEFDGSAGTASSANIDLSGGIVDISAANMVVGKGQSGGGGAETCTFNLGDGVLNANVLKFCDQGSSVFTGGVTVNSTFTGTQITVTNLLQMVVPISSTHARTLNFTMQPDANGVNPTLTTMGAVTTGFISPSLTAPFVDSAIKYTLTSTTWNMVNPQPIEAVNMSLTGSTISNASYILVNGQFLLLNNSKIIGSPILDMGVLGSPAGTAVWDLSGSAGTSPTFVVSNLLEGIGTIYGNLMQAPGATIQVGEGTVAGTLTISYGGIDGGQGNLTLNTNGNLQFGLSPSGFSGNDSINVLGALNLLGTNNVTLKALGGSFDTVNPYTLITTANPLPAGAANYFKASGALGGSRYILTFDTTSSAGNVLLHVSGSGPTSETWVGGLNGNAWDVKTTANWSGSSQFYDLDNVTFGDTGSVSPAVNTSGSSLIPGSMTVTTTNNNYAFGGTGSIEVGGAFTANAFGSVTITNDGGATFDSGLSIASNSVTLGGNGQFSIDGDPNTTIGLTLNGGSLNLAGNSTTMFVNPVFSQILNVNAGTVNVVNSNANVFNGSTINLVNANSFFVFGQPASVSAACDAVFSGSGQIIQNGPGLIALSGANGGVASPTLVNGGVLQTATGTAAGSVGVIVGPGGTLDVDGSSLGAITITASGLGAGGQGAVVSDSGTAGAFTGGLTLLANTSVGGIPAWNYDPVQNNGLLAMGGTLSASVITVNSTNAFNLNKVGGNEVQYNFSTVDPLLANIDVQGGMLYLENSGGLGNPTNTITAELGTVIAFANFSNGIPTKKWILNGDGTHPTLLDYNGSTMIGGPVTLNGDCFMSAVISSRGAPVSVEILGPISGTGSFDKPGAAQIGNDTWILDGTNTYSGNTTVTAGILQLQGNGSISNSPVISIQNGATFDVSLRANQTLTLNTGQTLTTLNGGNVNGNLVAGPGSAVAPGGAINLDSLSVSNGNITLGGTTSMKLAPLVYGFGVDSDQLNATNGGQTITYGGTLQLANLAGSYASGQSFQLFNATICQGAFSSIVPATPGAGLAWNTNSLTLNGTLTVMSTGGPGIFTNPTGITSFKLNGANVEITGSNGQAGDAYYLLRSTNVALPLSVWTVVATNVLNAGGTYTFIGTNVVVTNGLPQFYILSNTNSNH